MNGAAVDTNREFARNFYQRQFVHAHFSVECFEVRKVKSNAEKMSFKLFRIFHNFMNLFSGSNFTSYYNIIDS